MHFPHPRGGDISIENAVYNFLHSSGVLCAQIGGNLGYNWKMNRSN